MFTTISDVQTVNLANAESITKLKRHCRDEKYNEIQIQFSTRMIVIHAENVDPIYDDLVRKLTKEH